MQSTKISGLGVDTEYTFHLVLRTTAGTFSSEKVTVKTHKMTDLSGITVTPGILPAQLRDSLVKAVERIGAKMADSVRIDTTHFVTTEGRGIAWEKAVEMNIPVVRPEWVEGCERGGRIVGVRGYYLDADPRQRPVSQMSVQTQEHQPTNQARQQAPLPEVPAEQEEDKMENGSVKPANGQKHEDDSGESEVEEEETQKQEAMNEQKVRVEDREAQKVVLRPGDVKPSESTTSLKAPEAEDVSEDAEGAKTPGSASFQDVAL